MTNAEFNEQINELWAQTKAGNLPRDARFKAIESLTDEYVEATGKRPDSGALDRLATLCLYEEVTDDDRMKVRNNEAPIMSDRQIERREADQVSFTMAEEVGTDGRDYRSQTRQNRKKLRKY